MIKAGDTIELPFFPLPNFVLFPRVYAPLHIFEPRYRQMIENALDTNGLFVIGTLVGDWRPSYYEDASFHSHGCICEIADYQKVQQNRYNIMVKGVEVALLREVESKHLFRRVEATAVPTKDCELVEQTMLADLRCALLERLRESDVDASELSPHLEGLAPEDLINCVGFLAPLDNDLKLASLSADSYPQRCRLLLEGLSKVL
jgi:Lon protease-like protein